MGRGVETLAFLEWFEGIVVSGEEGIVKPDPRIFEPPRRPAPPDPPSTVFIDDNASNVEAAEVLGFIGIRFRDPAALRDELEAMALLPPAEAGRAAAHMRSAVAAHCRGGRDGRQSSE